MNSDPHAAAHGPAAADGAQAWNQLAVQATVHCLTGCGIGEVLGLVIATQSGWHDLPSIGLAIVLAFVFGYGLTLRPLLGSGFEVARASVWPSPPTRSPSA